MLVGPNMRPLNDLLCSILFILAMSYSFLFCFDLYSSLVRPSWQEQDR